MEAFAIVCLLPGSHLLASALIFLSIIPLHRRKDVGLHEGAPELSSPLLRFLGLLSIGLLIDRLDDPGRELAEVGPVTIA